VTRHKIALTNLYREKCEDQILASDYFNWFKQFTSGYSN